MEDAGHLTDSVRITMISLFCPLKLPSTARVQLASPRFDAAALNASPRFDAAALNTSPRFHVCALHALLLETVGISTTIS
jgi:hypothetical protein